MSELEALVAFKVLNLTFVFFGRLTSRERAQISAFFAFGVHLA
jgi:hypothetical protein